MPSKKQLQGKINLVNEENGEDVNSDETADYINKFFSEIGSKLAEGNNHEWKFYGRVEEDNCLTLEPTMKKY